MQQKDYILREIEKIGILLRGILGKMIRKQEDLPATERPGLEDCREQLLEEAGFDLDNYMSMDETAAREYLLRFNGFNVENLEILAEILFRLGTEEGVEMKKLLYLRSLEVYNWCSLTERSYSFQREANIAKIKSELEQL